MAVSVKAGPFVMGQPMSGVELKLNAKQHVSLRLLKQKVGCYPIDENNRIIQPERFVSNLQYLSIRCRTVEEDDPNPLAFQEGKNVAGCP